MLSINYSITNRGEGSLQKITVLHGGEGVWSKDYSIRNGWSGKTITDFTDVGLGSEEKVIQQ